MELSKQLLDGQKMSNEELNYSFGSCPNCGAIDFCVLYDKTENVSILWCSCGLCLYIPNTMDVLKDFWNRMRSKEEETEPISGNDNL